MSENVAENPFVQPAAPAVDQPSIVDTILRLDEFMSAEVRLAERTARFATKPDLEADIENLEAELDSLVDDQGRPITPAGEQSLDQEGGRTAAVVAAEIQALEEEYAASFRSIRLRQLNGDDWPAFKAEWREAIEGDDEVKRNEMLDALVVRCAIAPQLTPEAWAGLRPRIGGFAVEIVRRVAWGVNAGSGVSVPKSQLSSAVLRRQRLVQS
jgi:hypothetical protein